MKHQKSTVQSKHQTEETKSFLQYHQFNNLIEYFEHAWEWWTKST